MGGVENEREVSNFDNCFLGAGLIRDLRSMVLRDARRAAYARTVGTPAAGLCVDFVADVLSRSVRIFLVRCLCGRGLRWDLQRPVGKNRGMNEQNKYVPALRFHAALVPDRFCGEFSEKRRKKILSHLSSWQSGD